MGGCFRIWPRSGPGICFGFDGSGARGLESGLALVGFTLGAEACQLVMVLVSFRSPSRCAKPLLPPGLHAAGAVLIGIVATYWLAVRAMGSPCSDWRRHHPAQIRSRELRLQALLRRGDVSGLKGGAREPEGQRKSTHGRSRSKGLSRAIAERNLTASYSEQTAGPLTSPSVRIRTACWKCSIPTLSTLERSRGP